MRIKSSLTSGVREVLSPFPTVWTSERVPLVFIQAGIAVDSPTARHLVGGGGYKKTDLTDQFVWWRVHKLAVIATSVGSVGSHLLATHTRGQMGQLTSVYNGYRKVRQYIFINRRHYMDTID